MQSGNNSPPGTGPHNPNNNTDKPNNTGPHSQGPHHSSSADPRHHGHLPEVSVKNDMLLLHKFSFRIKTRITMEVHCTQNHTMLMRAHASHHSDFLLKELY